MDNVDNKRLSFPQKNWLLLCIIVAILSPLVVHLLQSGAKEKNYNEATHPVMTDTSYKMSAAPGNAGTPGAGSAGSAGSAGGAAASPGGAGSSGSTAAPASGDSAKKGGGN